MLGKVDRPKREFYCLAQREPTPPTVLRASWKHLFADPPRGGAEAEGRDRPDRVEGFIESRIQNRMRSRDIEL